MGRRRLMVATVVVALLLFGFASEAIAGGSWFDPVKDRYEPGEEVTLVGYTGSGQYGWISDGPFFGFLVDSENFGPDPDGMRRPLGEVQIDETGEGGYLTLRASITFLLPADLEPGIYAFDYCNADCSERLGHLIGGIIHVGVDPEYPPSREWPLDEPEIANLEPDALLSGPGFQVTAQEVSSGSIGVDANGYPTVGSTTTVAPTTSTPSPSTTELDEVIDSLPLADDTQIETAQADEAELVTVSTTSADPYFAVPDASRWIVIGVVLAIGLGVAALLVQRLRRRE